ncbi:hypothetical protein SCHPADRAFT_600535 [Schizopora paradoxa]|uniref:Uncharacterized protein n=1 Tax=Schizopora paradoxa TaxID=27342 RepID=A0A0H2R9Y8_9AGAM|nr:hypothetical protein SCHPADRAFT_600535 [Schizopora paradoxa]
MGISWAPSYGVAEQATPTTSTFVRSAPRRVHSLPGRRALGRRSGDEASAMSTAFEIDYFVNQCAGALRAHVATRTDAREQISANFKGTYPLGVEKRGGQVGEFICVLPSLRADSSVKECGRKARTIRGWCYAIRERDSGMRYVSSQWFGIYVHAKLACLGI